jgi:hypothetical protein
MTSIGSRVPIWRRSRVRAFAGVLVRTTVMSRVASRLAASAIVRAA